MAPPLLRRGTHLFCKYCGTNLYDYAQTECDRCQLSFGNDDMIVEFNRPKISRALRLYLFFKIKIHKFSNKYN